MKCDTIGLTKPNEMEKYMSKPVIKIPSKHIYSINNQKVVDNQVDKIEVQVKMVEPDNQYNISVHNQKVNLTSAYKGNSQQDYELDGRVGNQVVDIALAGVQLIPTYVNVTISVPIQMDISHTVNELNLGLDKNGNNEVGLRLYGTVINGTTSNTLTYSNPNNYFYLDKRNFDFNWDKTVFNQQEERQEDYHLQTTQTNSVSHKMSALDTLTSSITMTLDNKDNLSTNTTIRRVGDTAEVDFTILCGLKVVKLGAHFEHKSSTKTETVTLTGTYEEYIPTLCEVTIYGNTIGIKLVDETVTIGNGEHLMSFSGNELMQI